MTPEQFHEFARVLPEPLLLVTALGEILAGNQAAASILGCSRKLLTTKSLMDWVTEPPENVLSYLQSCATSRQMLLGALTFQLADGTLLSCRVEGAVLQPSTAELPARNLLRLENRAVTNSDFTLLNQKIDELTKEVYQRKQAQESLMCSHEELRQAQMQIVQSEKMSALGNLVASVAHEINNPIGFLNGSIRNAKDYTQDLIRHLTLYQQHHANAATPIQDDAEEIDLEFLVEDLPKLLDSMKGATDRIKGISTSLRTFSRADTEHKVSANLHEGIDSTLLILKYRLKANKQRPEIAIVKDYAELPTIDCFPGQLNQVFMNILANAIDMFDEMAQTRSLEDSKTNPQEITISTRVEANQVQIQIGDNGKGMTAELQAKIFDHLFTTKGVRQGTGLGLAIARQIVVEKHGGSLEAQSELGEGTQFLIQLPIQS